MESLASMRTARTEAAIPPRLERNRSQTTHATKRALTHRMMLSPHEITCQTGDANIMSLKSIHRTKSKDRHTNRGFTVLRPTPDPNWATFSSTQHG
jgi:hypothetical protein